MRLYREGLLELLKIQKALTGVGYYATSAELMAGLLVDTIHVRPFDKETDPETIRQIEEVLASLPDDADHQAFVDAYLAWRPTQEGGDS
jgi:hypothetical protein